MSFGTQKKSIVFTIEDGQVHVEAKGFVGSACEAATKEFTDALGGTLSGKVKKPEYFKKAEHALTQRA
jgi:hypothetical protein